jgi:choline dehydrogenase
VGLLMLSGIGPAGQLRQVGVDVRVDLPRSRREPPRPPIANVVHRAARPVPAARFNHGEAIGLLRSEKNRKPVLLELGGKNPITVLNDADIDYVVSGVLMPGSTG